MQCVECGAVLPEGAQVCPECGRGLDVAGSTAGAELPSPQVSATQAASEPTPDAQTEPAPPPAPAEESAVESAAVPSGRGRRVARAVAIVVGVVVLVGGAAVAALLLFVPTSRTATPMPAAYAPVRPDTSFTDTGTLSPADAEAAEKTAAEKAVVTFYETIDAGDFASLGALVTSDSQSAVDPGAFEGWASTTFTPVRSTVDSDAALVFGHESRRAFGSKTLGVKFTLQRVGSAWLIETWQAVDEGAVNGAVPSSGQGAGSTALTAASARDLVDALLQARQKGDADTIRLLTTAKFQRANGPVWLDGVDNSAFFTGFTIRSAQKHGAAYVVMVRETWNSGVETATYRVIKTGGALLVDSWASK